MKAVLQDMKSGDMHVAEVPPPALQAGGILVRVRRSLISIGTERAVIELAHKGPLGKARERPDLARKVLNKAKQEGYWNTYKVVRNLIDTPIPLGYSCAGVVIGVGEGASEFRVGERVACAGLNFANHAEIDYIPRNLAAHMPENLTFDDACFVTLGAIAMQGVRLANIELGERVVVLGLGLVGQIAAQLARCAGASVFAFDLDPAKAALAAQLGAHSTESNPQRLAAAVSGFTGGAGADAVLVCAATKSNQPLADAAAMSRLKGRVVVVGDVGMQIERRPFFEKELNLVVSRSYGPGRYDPAYELHGVEYPLPFVRWTEQRNMQSFLELCARGDVRVGPLVTQRYPIERAEEAYRIVTGEDQRTAIAILLEYERAETPLARVEIAPAAPRKPAAGDAVRLGIIGAGQFGKAVLLPAFRRIRGVSVEAVCTATGLSSRKIAEAYDARFCTSDANDIIADPNVDAVVIGTRHDQHAALVAAALRAGKAVFVEKPLAIDRVEFEQLSAWLRAIDAPPLMVGFNRRFAPLARRCRDFFQHREQPLFAMYRVNAGYFPPDSWVFDPLTGGGRVLGEVCHFIDTLCYLTGSLPERLSAEEIRYSLEPAHHRDSVSITLRFVDGSVGAIHYLADGDASVPKEYLEVFGGQRTALLDNYRELTLHSSNKRKRHRLMNQAKGHVEETAAFIHALRTQTPMPIDLETILAVTRSTFLVHDALDTGGPIELEDNQPTQ